MSAETTAFSPPGREPLAEPARTDTAGSTAAARTISKYLVRLKKGPPGFAIGKARRNGFVEPTVGAAFKKEVLRKLPAGYERALLPTREPGCELPQNTLGLHSPVGRSRIQVANETNHDLCGDFGVQPGATVTAVGARPQAPMSGFLPIALFTLPGYPAWERPVARLQTTILRMGQQHINIKPLRYRCCRSQHSTRSLQAVAPTIAPGRCSYPDREFPAPPPPRELRSEELLSDRLRSGL